MRTIENLNEVRKPEPELTNPRAQNTPSEVVTIEARKPEPEFIEPRELRRPDASHTTALIINDSDESDFTFPN